MAENVKRSFTLPKPLYEQLERIAAKENRTVNGQAVRWLEQKAREYEAIEKSEKSEKSPGPRFPTRLGQVPA
jgi:hypothetical protein